MSPPTGMQGYGALVGFLKHVRRISFVRGLTNHANCVSPLAIGSWISRQSSPLVAMTARGVVTRVRDRRHGTRTVRAAC